MPDDLPEPERDVRLQDFILANVEPILVEWTSFARTQDGAAGMNRVELRDHAGDILRHIARDLGTPQSDSEQQAKSYGESDAGAASTPAEDRDADTPAETHGSDRAESGFTFAEMIAEFRALRASVLRLWIRAQGSLTEEDLADLMRFNEAIDQAVAESVSRFSKELESAKDMFIAILSHDLRTPLQAVLFSTRLLLDDSLEREAKRAALSRIERSTWRMSGMIEDLLDFTSARIGAGINIQPSNTDLGALMREAVDEARGAYPEVSFEVHDVGQLHHECDAGRLRQVLANLLSNAADYSDGKVPVAVEVEGGLRSVSITVRNRGDLIPQERMRVIFDPFKRLQQVPGDADDARHLGLGLYIAERIVTAHGGRISVTSSEVDGTCFTVTLPR